MNYLIFIFAFLIFSSCTEHSSISGKNPLEQEEKTLTYLALGDSYTIGQGVTPFSSFPFQLYSRLQNDGFLFSSEPKIIAQTGWTCIELSKNIDDAKLKEKSFDLVTLLIGVNDQYRKQNIGLYANRFTELVEKAIFYSGDKDKVVILSIPDYSVTPFGGGSQQIAKEIMDYNTINKKIAEDYGIEYVDITPISQKAKLDISYLASDQLHPSAKMYAEWVEEMYPSD